MILTAFAAVGFGLIIASITKDFQGFQFIMNLPLFPLVLLSSAFFPISGLPSWLKILSLINPLTYAVDGIRGSLVGYQYFPLYFDFLVLLMICIAMLFLGSYPFNKSEI